MPLQSSTQYQHQLAYTIFFCLPPTYCYQRRVPPLHKAFDLLPDHILVTVKSVDTKATQPSDAFFFHLVPVQTSSISYTTPSQPQAHLVTNPFLNQSWLLDSGASHHVTSDLNNLSLHTPYIGYDDIMIEDGVILPITHTGFTSLHTPPNTFTLDNVLCVYAKESNLYILILSF